MPSTEISEINGVKRMEKGHKPDRNTLENISSSPHMRRILLTVCTGELPLFCDDVRDSLTMQFRAKTDLSIE
jgi:hypothetical protein